MPCAGTCGVWIEGSEATVNVALQAVAAASEAQKGAEQVASAAEEQSAAAAEAQTAVGQQAQSLEQGQVAARALAALTEQLRSGAADDSGAAQIGAMAEELSATVQELSTAAGQIMSAVAQINRGSRLQASATQQTSAALTQIERGAGDRAGQRSGGGERVLELAASVTSNRLVVERLVAGIGEALTGTGASLGHIVSLETMGRRIDKIVDGIALIAVQTSMLAVSGAVEAARAGDSGRGFAVVSNDIRGLARDAAESADRIKDMVRGDHRSDRLGAARPGADCRLHRCRGSEGGGNLRCARRHGYRDRGFERRQRCYRPGRGNHLGRHWPPRRRARGRSRPLPRKPVPRRRRPRPPRRSRPKEREDLAAAVEEIASLAEELRQGNG